MRPGLSLGLDGEGDREENSLAELGQITSLSTEKQPRRCYLSLVVHCENLEWLPHMQVGIRVLGQLPVIMCVCVDMGNRRDQVGEGGIRGESGDVVVYLGGNIEN